MDGYWTLKIPESVGLPDDPASDLILECVTYCDDSLVTLSYSDRILSFDGAMSDSSSYIMNPGPIVFKIEGFTNPATSEPAYFQFTSYATLDGDVYMIDQLSDFYIEAELGECTISKFYPTDGNYMIYGVAQSWTVTMTCEH